ncbi:molecular chaperone [Klebsiella aerogenes]|uniref:fimbrial biogenesis chaperone n=1 Tax=Klebsiella aerogenes TaxID=548 RepID=UPI000B41C226|nr:molecular chaperone [Klebsiella aerogenes]ELA2681534.1 molecular chaperone [Klebsiella aerogenes]RNT26359.1 molecular chaperone [Klebsiella aerogenes]HBV9946260.1 molecular chaperone [Klebsiella aerogenes]HEJ0418020.1 molecular chaperone [Klebsiella aerogenes]
MMKYKAFLFFLYIMPLISRAGVIATPTRIIYSENSKAHSVAIKNESENTFLASAIFEEKGRSFFTVTPPIARLKTGENMLLRIRGINTKELPTDRESVFYYSITMVPNQERTASQQNRIAMASRYWFKLFYRPNIIGTPLMNSCNLEFKNNNKKMDVKNNSPFYSTLVFLSVNGNRVFLSPEEAMIAPYSSQSISISTDASVVEWIRINDYGSLEKKCTYFLKNK